MASRSKIAVYSGLLAAAYVVITWAVAPLSFGPIQFRVSEILKPAALLHPAFAIAFGVGNGIANLVSPFGAWDFVVMSMVDAVAALICWNLRRWPWIAITVQAIVIAAGVALFPLGMVLMLPFWPTFAAVLTSELILMWIGYAVIWRRYGNCFLRQWQS